MAETVAIVGVGGMGGGVADRLLSQGHQVVLWNRSAAALDAYAGRAGAARAATPAEAASRADHAISFVADDAALEAVTTGPGGLLAGLREDAVHISMSSVSPTLVATLAAAHEAAGRGFVAAPVFGRPTAAAAGQLWIASAGAEGALDRVRPLFEILSRSVHVLGRDPAAALKAKIAGNFLIASAIEAMAEAFAMLEGTGADPGAFHDLMSDSIFGSVIHRNYGRIILDRAFTPPGFKLALGAKDVGLAGDLAAAAGSPFDFGEVLRTRFAAALSQGSGEDDWNAISEQVRRP